MYYSVCLPAVLRGVPMEESLKTVRKAGFDRYEIWGWWNLELENMQNIASEQDLSITALCTKFVPLTNSDLREQYLEGLKETALTCRKLGCKTVISQVGQELQGVSRKLQHKSIVEGLKACVPILEAYNLTLVIEPLNTKINHPGYYLWKASEAFEIIEEVGSEQVKVLYDLYHQYVMDDLDLDAIVQNIDKIGHFHMAGFPGRNEPFIKSEIDYNAILKVIKESGYRYSVGMEYIPVYNTEKGLKDLFLQLQQI